MRPDISELSIQLFDQHEAFRESALSHRRFKHADIVPLIEKHRETGFWKVAEVGASFEGRAIRTLSAGHGAQKVCLWSQMHGDEPTATMALFDIFNFLEASGDGFDVFRQHILAQTSLTFLPMLNPDGAERYQRATAQMIDMNRDALALQTPEARILKGLIESEGADFGFNLHDQNPRYTAGNSPNLATISFLATAYDYASSVNDIRLRSMQLIAFVNEVLQRFIPDQTGRFSDEHEPRAFGDNIQKWGTTLVLFESGGYRNDIEKQYVRKLNFVGLLVALGAIATGEYQRKTRAEYESIPLNARTVYDLIVRGATVRQDGRSFKIDIGINREEVILPDRSGFYYRSVIEEIGDLSTYYGLEELDAEGVDLMPGLVYPEIVLEESVLNQLDAPALWSKGQLFVRLSDGLFRAVRHNAPATSLFVTLHEHQPLPESFPRPGATPAFLLTAGEVIRYAMVNGFVHAVNPEPTNGN